MESLCARFLQLCPSLQGEVSFCPPGCLLHSASALSSTCCNCFSVRICELKAQQDRTDGQSPAAASAPRVSLTGALKQACFQGTFPLFALKASECGEPFYQQSELLSVRGNSRWGSVRFYNYSSSYSHTLSHTQRSFVIGAGLSHTLLCTAEERSMRCCAQLQLCRSFAGSSDSLLSFLRGIPLSIRGSVPPRSAAGGFNSNNAANLTQVVFKMFYFFKCFFFPPFPP